MDHNCRILEVETHLDRETNRVAVCRKLLLSRNCVLSLWPGRIQIDHPFYDVYCKKRRVQCVRQAMIPSSIASEGVEITTSVVDEGERHDLAREKARM